MDDITIQQNCKLLLTKFPELRNPILKKQRIWAYWQYFEGVNIGIIKSQFIKLTDGESISRAFRKVLELNPHLRASTELQQKGAEMAEKHRQAYLNIDKK